MALYLDTALLPPVLAVLALVEEFRVVSVIYCSNFITLVLRSSVFLISIL
jgi:hypothetical protein